MNIVFFLAGVLMGACAVTGYACCVVGADSERP